ncbi:hypothetical protein U1Q18_010431 [Sarracenia purpurea var. burkii]
MTELNNNIGQTITDAFGNPANPFQYGAGHLRPVKAADPGLVYDASYTDYLLFLCTNGVSNLDPSFSCPKSPPPSNALNYPSLSISKLNGTVSVKRTVTNVGGRRSVYFSSVKPPPGFSVKVSPPILFFHRVGQKRSFTITVEAKREAEGGAAAVGGNEYAFGWYSWYDGVHFVRSPMVILIA